MNKIKLRNKLALITDRSRPTIIGALNGQDVTHV
jgi:hypothetical protein